MRTALTTLAALVLTAGLAWAAEKSDAASPATQPGDFAAVAKLRAEMHRTMAALIEAQAAEKPDPERIRSLTEQVGKLRREIWQQTGGPGMGRGPGMGMGPGMGRGPGWGRGAGYRAGMGWGPGFVDRNNDGVCDNQQQAQPKPQANPLPKQ